MASRKKSDYHKQMAARADEDVLFFSDDREGKRKAERERRTCAAFLRCLGVPFSIAGLKSVAHRQDPPDVNFDDAHFEVCEALDQGRKRHDEVRARRQRVQRARTDEDLYLPPQGKKSLGPYGSCAPLPLSLAEIYNHVTEELAKKCARPRYTEMVRAELDALVCIELLYNFLLPDPPMPCYDALLQQGWRSVSFLMPPYSHVIYAKRSAPTFLQENHVQIRNASPHPDLFSLEPEA